MIIKAWSSRMSETFYNENAPFELDDDSKSYSVSLELFDDNDDNDDCGELMATLRATVYDCYDIEDVFLAADDESGDESCAIEYLIRTGEYEKANLWTEFLCHIYLDRLYVEPSYRNRGLATWILENFENLFMFYFRVQPHCVITIPAPDGYIELEKHTDEEKKDILKLHKLMTKVIKKYGFKKIRGENAYYKNFAVK